MALNILSIIITIVIIVKSEKKTRWLALIIIPAVYIGILCLTLFLSFTTSVYKMDGDYEGYNVPNTYIQNDQLVSLVSNDTTEEDALKILDGDGDIYIKNTGNSWIKIQNPCYIKTDDVDEFITSSSASSIKSALNSRDDIVVFKCNKLKPDGIWKFIVYPIYEEKNKIFVISDHDIRLAISAEYNIGKDTITGVPSSNIKKWEP
jgi:hypothetical protein